MYDTSFERSWQQLYIDTNVSSINSTHTFTRSYGRVYIETLIFSSTTRCTVEYDTSFERSWQQLYIDTNVSRVGVRVRASTDYYPSIGTSYNE